MRNALVGLVVGIAIAGALCYFLWRTPLADAQRTAAVANTRAQQLEASLAARQAKPPKPRDAVIVLSKGPTAQCLATINYPHTGGGRGDELSWSVVDDENNRCNPSGPWAVWLRFAGPDLPFDDRQIRVGRSQKKVKIKSDANYGTFPYKVWMLGHGLSEYELIDPDVEVERPYENPPPKK